MPTAELNIKKHKKGDKNIAYYFEMYVCILHYISYIIFNSTMLIEKGHNLETLFGYHLHLNASLSPQSISSFVQTILITN